MTSHPIDDMLSNREGRLFIEEIEASELLRRFGSPLFILSEDQLRRNVRRFQTAFQSGWSQGPVKVMPAVKANWVMASQRILAEEGCGADIYSPGELRVALEAGFDPRFISVNGVPKDPQHIRTAVEAGARITIDSLEEVEHIERAAKELGKTAFVRLRLKPLLSSFIEKTDFVPEGPAPTDVAAIAYKGGLAYEHVEAIAPVLRRSPHMELVGFHQHHGRHKRTAAYWAAQMKAYAYEMGRVSKLLGGFQPKEIDIGGGFAIPRDPHNAAADYAMPYALAALFGLSRLLKLLGDRVRYGVLAPLVEAIGAAPNATPAPSIEEYASVCTRTLREELPRHGINTKDVILQLEPGRSLHGNTGVHLTTVRAIKRTTKPVRWNVAIVDTTEFWFTGGRYEHHLHAHVVANRMDAKPVERTDVIGKSCYGDRLLPAVLLPRLEVGDVLAFLDTGAYQEVSCSNFNAMPRPGVVLVSKDVADIVRRPETQDEVFARDVVPERLETRDAPRRPEAHKSAPAAAQRVLDQPSLQR